MTDNGLIRFFRLGARDADARVAAWLASPGSAATERHIAASRIVTVIDTSFRRLEAWWRASTTANAASAAIAAWSTARPREQQQSLGMISAVAAGTHIGLTLVQGARPGWFWLLIPGMVLAFGLLLVVASRSAKSPG